MYIGLHMGPSSLKAVLIDGPQTVFAEHTVPLSARRRQCFSSPLRPKRSGCGAFGKCGNDRCRFRNCTPAWNGPQHWPGPLVGWGVCPNACSWPACLQSP